VLQAIDGVGLPSTSNLVFSGSLAQNGYGAVLQGSGTFSRILGTVAGQVQWTGDGGFAAKGGPLTVCINNNPFDPLLWGYTGNASSFVGDGNVLTFGSSTADSQVNFTNSIDLTGGSRQIDVAAGMPGSSVLFSGNITDDIFGGASLTKTGGGTLILSGTNDYSGGTYVEAGKLVLLSSDALADGTSLTVGNPALFESPVVPSSQVSSAPQAIAPVPEPGTLVLLLTALLCGGRRVLRAGRRLAKRHDAE
jgi:autotransporter-associated beta strand protein